jgi:hypothetical protein
MSPGWDLAIPGPMRPGARPSFDGRPELCPVGCEDAEADRGAGGTEGLTRGEDHRDLGGLALLTELIFEGIGQVALHPPSRARLPTFSNAREAGDRPKLRVEVKSSSHPKESARPAPRERTPLSGGGLLGGLGVEGEQVGGRGRAQVVDHAPLVPQTGQTQLYRFVWLKSSTRSMRGAKRFHSRQKWRVVTRVLMPPVSPRPPLGWETGW